MTALVEPRVDVRAHRLRLRRRAAVVTGAVGLLASALFVATLMVGSFGLTATTSLTLNRRRWRSALSVSKVEYSRLLKGFGDTASSSDAR